MKTYATGGLLKSDLALIGKRSINIYSIIIIGLLLFNGLFFINIFDITRYGFDFTDEAYYIESIFHAFEFEAPSITLFGKFYSFFNFFFEKNIIRARVFNVFQLILASGLVLYYCCKKDQLHVLLFMSMGMTCLIFGNMWNPSPSYNSLNFLGVAIATCGIIKLISDENYKRLNCIIFNIGFCFSFIAKPTTSFLLLILFASVILFFKRQYIKSIIFSSAIFYCSIIALIYLFYQTSPLDIINFYQLGLTISKTLAIGNSPIDFLFRKDALILIIPNEEAHYILAYSALGALICYAGNSNRKFLRLVSFLLLISQLAISIYLIWLDKTIWFEPNLFIMANTLIPLLTLLIYISFSLQNSVKMLDRKSFSIIVILLLMPFVYGFGSSNSYFLPAFSASIFFLAGAIKLAHIMVKKSSLKLVLLTLACQVTYIMTCNFKVAISNPYRQHTSLTKKEFFSNYVIANGTSLKLTSSVIDYISNVELTMIQNGFQSSDKLIDLTGQSAGLAYILNTRMLGAPWLVGEYTYSNLNAYIILSYVTCKDFSKAWLVLEEENKERSKISFKALSILGLKLEEHYQLIAQINAIPRTFPFYTKQEIYKPKDGIYELCNRARINAGFKH